MSDVLRSPKKRRASATPDDAAAAGAQALASRQGRVPDRARYSRAHASGRRRRRRGKCRAGGDVFVAAVAGATHCGAPLYTNAHERRPVQDVEPSFGKILNHAFPVGLADGTLEESSFLYFLIQNFLLLKDYGRGLSLAAAKAGLIERVLLLSGPLRSIQELQVFHEGTPGTCIIFCANSGARTRAAEKVARGRGAAGERAANAQLPTRDVVPLAAGV